MEKQILQEDMKISMHQEKYIIENLPPLKVQKGRMASRTSPFFFLDAAWLNEGRCPGGRPSVSEN